MRKLRCLLAAAATVMLALPAMVAVAEAQTKITIGKVLSGNGFHIPSYVAMDQGYYKAEGLDASFVSLTGRALVTAALSGSIDFVPIPSGGAQAALSGAEIRYVVGQSLRVAMADRSPPQYQQGRGPEGQDVGLRSHRLRRLR